MVSLRAQTDRCDGSALLCRRQSECGGDSLIVATPAIHNAMPELLFQPWPISRQQKQRPREASVYRNATCPLHAGRVARQLSRSAPRFEETRRRAPDQLAALDLLDARLQELPLACGWSRATSRRWAIA